MESFARLSSAGPFHWARACAAWSFAIHHAPGTEPMANSSIESQTTGTRILGRGRPEVSSDAARLPLIWPNVEVSRRRWAKRHDEAGGDLAWSKLWKHHGLRLSAPRNGWAREVSFTAQCPEGCQPTRHKLQSKIPPAEASRSTPPAESPRDGNRGLCRPLGPAVR